MITYVMMGMLVLELAVTVLWRIKYLPNKNGFMSIEDSTFLRGFWCIIVVLVHVPYQYQNQIQDMIGSFAYIGVTFFFMTSAYGLKYSMINKLGYMKHFWRRRLPHILIPAVLVNLTACIVEMIQKRELSILSVININAWVKVLLVCYFLFWLINYVMPKFIKIGAYSDLLLCIVMLVWSLVERLTGTVAMGWEVERLGFVYGLLLAKYYDSVNIWIHNSWKIKTLVLFVLSGILGIAYLNFKPIEFYGDYLLRTLLGTVLTSFVLVITSGFKVGNHVNNFLGSVSYEVYLLHIVVFSVMPIIAPHLNSGIFIVVSIIVTTIISFGLNKLSKQMLRVFFSR